MLLDEIKKYDFAWKARTLGKDIFVVPQNPLVHRRRYLVKVRGKGCVQAQGSALDTSEADRLLKDESPGDI